MRRSAIGTDGFSLVEVIIAMLLLGVIAMALLPALWQGIRYSSQQSATATATRHLNSLIEDARATPTCAMLSTVTSSSSISDGKGATVDIAGTYDTTGCAKGAAVPVTLTATDDTGTLLARVSARVYIP